MCTKTYTEDASDDSWGGNGSCAKGDAQINFSGKIGGGWTYALNIDPSDWKDSGNVGAEDATNDEVYVDKESAGIDMMSSVLLEKTFDMGLTVGIGDTGDGDKLKNYAGHWELVTHSDPVSGGGLKIAYAKAGLDASLVLGGLRAKADDDGALGNDFSIGAGYALKVGGSNIDVGASYHSTQFSDVVKEFGINKSFRNFDIGGTNYATLPDNATSMTFGAGATFGAYNIGVDYFSSTTKAKLCAAFPANLNPVACNTPAYAGATSNGEIKDTAMGAHVWASSGTWRPGLSYTSEKREISGDGAVGAQLAAVLEPTTTTQMGAGVAWHPKEGGPSIRFDYISVKDDDDNDDDDYTQMRVRLAASVNLL